MSETQSKRGAGVRTGTPAMNPRDEILAAAAHSIARLGFHGMSMRELARATGKSPASFYAHFESKEDLLYELQSHAFEELIARAKRATRAEHDPVDRFYAFIESHLAYFAEHPDVMRVLVQEAGTLPADRRTSVRALKTEYFEMARELVQVLAGLGCGGHGSHALHDAGDAEIDRVAYSVFGMLNWTYGWYEPERHGSPQELARTIHRVALCGLVAHCPSRAVQSHAHGVRAVGGAR
jgi:AcrR family transcriptional regulator